MKTIHELLQWRYATKQFDPNQELSVEDLDYVVTAGNLAPTSYGLQPIGFVVVTDSEIKKQLQPVSLNQPQVVDCAALVVVCARTDVDATMVQEYIDRIYKTRALPADTLDGMQNMLTGAVENMSQEQSQTWAAKQSYIALGIMMTAAAERGIDSCPMEGLDPDGVDQVLGLAEHNLHTVTYLALGHRSENDQTQHAAKVRRSLDDIVIRK